MSKASSDDTRSANFEQILKEVRAALSGWNRADVLGRYRIGEHIADVKKNDNKYGFGAVQKIAREIGYGDTWLYDCASVAEVFHKEEIEEILGRRDAKRNQTLSWSHLLLIAQFNRRADRKSWINKTLKNGWTARELNSEMNPEPETSADATDANSRLTQRWLGNIQAIAESDVSRQKQWLETIFSAAGS